MTPDEDSLDPARSVPPGEEAGTEASTPEASATGALPLEEDVVDCPNCGAPMRGDDTLLCLRCGYDLKSMSVVETVAADDPTAGAATEAVAVPAITRPGAGGLRLPGAMAVLAAVAMIVGYLAGARGLFPALVEAADGPAPTIGWDLRFEFAARFPVLLALWTMCGVGALGALAWLFGREFGDVRLAVVRMVGIMAVARTVSFLDLGWPIAEFIAEAVGQSAVFVVLAAILFRLKLKEAGILLALCIGAFVVLSLGAHLIAWAM